jgi:SPFH domain / Band 7 family
MSKSQLSKIAFATVLACAGVNALAYYDTTDRAEWIEIGANESAFMLPMTGANKTNQAKFGSIAYLDENKVAAKRVQIPHAKADNTGAFADKYVATHRVYILDRAPYTRDWNNAVDKGTSPKKEGFVFESADSFRIETAVTISALVKEEDAAKFFYWFGSQIVAANNAPEAVFASTARGRSLADVMDTVVHSRVQALLAREFGKRKLIDAMQNKAAIMDAVEATITKEFAAQGITITNIGYSADLTYDKKIQDALDSAFIAQMKLTNKDAYNVALDLDKRDAENNLIRAQGETMKKWNGTISFPSFMVISDKLAEMFGGWFGSKTDSAKK